MLLVQIDRTSKTSLQEQIASEIVTHIEKGTLMPGSKIPSSRMLAQHLKLSRNTVMYAYQRLISEGFIETLASSETRVSEVLPKDLMSVEVGISTDEDHVETSADIELTEIRHTPTVFSSPVQEISNINERRILYDFWVGRPHHKLFPSKIWQKLLNDCVSYSSRQLAQYGNPAGLESLREAIAEHVRYTRAIPATANQIIITVGTQEALNIISRLLISKGAKVAIEDPCSQSAAFVFKSYGAELVPIPVDSGGLEISALPEKGSSFVYTTPSHQYPLGVSMPMNRRKELISWAERTGSYIVEDDSYSDFRYENPPLQAVSGLSTYGHAIYLGTFSKSIGAGLRLAYMVLPEQLIKPAVQVKTLFSNHNGWLGQAVMAKFIQEGYFEKHLRIIRKDYKTRRDILTEELSKNFDEVDLKGLGGGMHVIWTLPSDFPFDAELLKREVVKVGVGLYTLNSGGATELIKTTTGSRTLILGYSSLDYRQITEGISRVKETMQRLYLRKP